MFVRSAGAWTGHAGVVNGSPVAVEAVRVQLDDVALGDLRRRLAASRLVPDDGGGWERGVPRPWLAALLADWQRFDTAAFQARLDRLAHFQAVVGGQVIHLVHAPGRGPAAHATTPPPGMDTRQKTLSRESAT